MITAAILCALVLGAVAVALVPLSTSDLDSHPHPLAAYAAAESAGIQRQRADAITAAPGGSSILLLHGARTARVVVLLHGFTNSPKQFALLAQQLYAQGDNVYVPRLPRHAERGGTAATFAAMTAAELRDAADSAVDIATGLGDTVVVLGLSAGGTMASWIAQNRPEPRRVVIVAPMIAIARVPRFLDRAVMSLAVRMPNVTHKDPLDSFAPDREEGWTTRAVGQILRLGLAVQRAAKRTAPVTRDVSILLNAHDQTISADATLQLALQWSSHGAVVHAYRLSDSLALPHDVIDPRQHVRRPDVVYPVLVALLNGDEPPMHGVATVGIGK